MLVGCYPQQPECLFLLCAPAVTNCSLFNPTPSMSAMVINHFKMRSDVDSYNLGGWAGLRAPRLVGCLPACLACRLILNAGGGFSSPHCLFRLCVMCSMQPDPPLLMSWLQPAWAALLASLQLDWPRSCWR